MWLSILRVTSPLLHNLITSQKEEAQHHGTKNFNTSKGPASSFIREVQGGGPNSVLKAQGFLVQVPQIHFIVGYKCS